MFRLQNPDRLVIDLPDTRRRAKLPPPPERGIVAGLRSGVSDAHVLRLVVELRAPTQSQVQPVASRRGLSLAHRVGCGSAVSAISAVGASS